MEEDALKAIETYQNYSLKGRKLKLESAVKDSKGKPSHDTSQHTKKLTPTPSPTTNNTKTTTESTDSSPTTKPTAIPSSLIEQINLAANANTSRTLKFVAFGVPSHIKKKEFKSVTSKACRKAEITSIDKVLLYVIHIIRIP